MEEEWKSVYQEQSARMEKAASGLSSTVGTNLSVDPLPYLRLMLELLQSHHDTLYAIREQLSELANSVTAMENRLEVVEEEGNPTSKE
jgi:nitrate reductase assembly molybdenum cofactor insertion protein NarJ